MFVNDPTEEELDIKEEKFDIKEGLKFKEEFNGHEELDIEEEEFDIKEESKIKEEFNGHEELDIEEEEFDIKEESKIKEEFNCHEELDIEEDEFGIPEELSPLKKSKQGQRIQKSQKLMVISLHKKLKEKNPKIQNKDAIALLAEQTRIGIWSVKNILLDYKRTGTVAGNAKHRSSFKENIDESQKNAVRRKIHEFYTNGQLPTLMKVLRAVNADVSLPNFTRRSFYALLEDINFTYIKEDHNSILTERDDVVIMRRNYLRSIGRYREEGRPIYYLDEICIGANDVESGRFSTDETVDSDKRAFLEGSSTGPSNRSKKRKRLIILHIASAAGFVPGGLLYLVSRKTTGDYHEEIKSDTFHEWFENILPSLENNAVIVMDNEAYHSAKLETLPNSTWKKVKIIKWLKRKGKEISEDMLKTELMQIVDLQRDKFDTYVVEDIARRNDKTILRLPSYHCELNLIVLAWSMVKGYVRMKNDTFNVKDVKGLIEKGIDRVTAEDWSKFVGLVKNEERKMWEIDDLADRMTDAIPQLINHNFTSEMDYETFDCDS